MSTTTPALFVDPDWNAAVLALAALGPVGFGILAVGAAVVAIAAVNAATPGGLSAGIQGLLEKVAEDLKHSMPRRDLTWIQDPTDPKKHAQEVEDAVVGLERALKSINGRLSNDDKARERRGVGTLNPRERAALEKARNAIEKRLKDIKDAQQKAKRTKHRKTTHESRLRLQ